MALQGIERVTEAADDSLIHQFLKFLIGEATLITHAFLHDTLPLPPLLNLATK